MHYDCLVILCNEISDLLKRDQIVFFFVYQKSRLVIHSAHLIFILLHNPDGEGHSRASFLQW